LPSLQKKESGQKYRLGFFSPDPETDTQKYFPTLEDALHIQTTLA
jgi:hypothetical protein